MNDIMVAHKQLSDEMEIVLETIIQPDYEDLPDWLKDSYMKERKRLEMLLEVLEEDSEYQRVSL